MRCLGASLVLPAHTTLHDEGAKIADTLVLMFYKIEVEFDSEAQVQQIIVQCLLADAQLFSRPYQVIQLGKFARAMLIRNFQAELVEMSPSDYLLNDFGNLALSLQVSAGHIFAKIRLRGLLQNTFHHLVEENAVVRIFPCILLLG